MTASGRRRPRVPAWITVSFAALILTGVLDWALSPAKVRESWPEKFQTIDRVLARGELIGLTRDEVRTRFGDPEPQVHYPAHQMVYRLGAQRSGFIRIDEDWLFLTVDQNGKVAEADIRTY